MTPRRFSAGGLVPGPRWFQSLGKVVAAASIRATAPLFASTMPGGTRLELRPQPRFNGVVTAYAGGAYTVAEAVFSPTTRLWSVLAGGRTVLNAYEYNSSTTVTIGSAVEVRAFPSGDWRFYVVRYGTAGSGCSTIPTVSITLAMDCCPCPAATVTLTRSGTTVGSCSISGPTFGNNGVCTIAVDLPPGTVVDYAVVASPYPAKSGSFVVPACGSNTSVVVPLTLSDLYGSLTLTDPLGNAILLTLSGTRYVGSHTYVGVYEDAFGVWHDVTYDFEFNGTCVVDFSGSNVGCSLTMGVSSGGVITGYCFASSAPPCSTITLRTRACNPLLFRWTFSTHHAYYYGSCSPFDVFRTWPYGTGYTGTASYAFVLTP